MLHLLLDSADAGVLCPVVDFFVDCLCGFGKKAYLCSPEKDTDSWACLVLTAREVLCKHAVRR